MRILFTSWPGWGHLLPMYPLARAAQQAGHEVVFVSGSDVAEGLRRDGFHTWSVGPTWDQAVTARAAAERRGSQSWEARVAADVQEMFVPASIRRAEDTLPLAELWSPDLVIHGAGDASGPAVAAELGVPSVLHGLGLVPPGFEKLVEPMMSAAGKRLGLPGLGQRVLGGIMVDLTPPSLLPSAYAESPDRQALQPSAGDVEPDPEIGEAIGGLPFERTVYLTLGTIMNNKAGVMETALRGALSCDANIVVTTGPNGDPRRFGDLPAHVLVRAHIRQATVLAHCSAVISHAGAGTMLAALSLGLPQLTVPMGADQPFNAATLERVGAGLRIEPADLSATRVRKAVQRLLTEAAFTTSARRLQAEIADMPPASQVLRVVEQRLMAPNDRDRVPRDV